MAEFFIKVVDLDDSVDVRVFDSEEEYAFEYADYCACGYDVHNFGPRGATARRMVE